MKKERIRYATITIDKIREVHRNELGYEYKDKMFCAEIKDGSHTTMFCESTRKKLFREIKSILYI